MHKSLFLNEIHHLESGKALGDAIAANTVLKELDLSGDDDNYGIKGVEFVEDLREAKGVGAAGVWRGERCRGCGV